MISTSGSWSLTAVFFLITVVWYVYIYAHRNFNYWSNKGVPSVRPIPFLGNFKNVLLQKITIGHFLADLYNKTSGDFFGMWIFNTPHLVLRSPELIKHILVKDFDHFSDRTVVNDPVADPILSKSLFFLQNPEWKTMRSKISPIFTSGKIRGMVPLINQAGVSLKKYLEKEAGKEKSIEAKEVCAKFTTDVITSCAFGVEANSFTREDAEFRKVGRAMFEFSIVNAIRATSYFFIPSIVKWFRLSFFKPSVNDFCRNALTFAIKERERTGHIRNDLIDIIIAMKKAGEFEGIPLDKEREIAHAMQFFAAGFETTSSTIAFTLYEMCMNNDVQTKLREEINTVLEKHGGLVYEALGEMKYMDKVVKEVLRKYPTLPFLDRRCIKDYKIPDSDIVIEKGTPVYIPMFGLHYDPQYYPNPDVFDPDRFNEENVAERHGYSYLPFGGGPHNCIGERFGLIASKFGIIKVLSDFIVEPSEDTPISIEFDPKALVLLSKVGLPMKFSPYIRN